MSPGEWPSGRSRDGGVDEIPLPAGVGRLGLCGKHVVGPDPERALRATGADVVVCLCEEHEIAARYPGYVAWLRAEARARALWAPVPDLHAPPPSVVAVVAERLASGEGLLVHCGAGIGRAGTVAVGVLVAMGAGLPDALRVVGSSRPMAGPEAGAQTAFLEDMAP